MTWKARVSIGFLAAALLLAAGSACKKSEISAGPADKELADLEAEKAAADAEAEEAAKKAASKPASKMNDAFYVEITARMVLIQEKFKEEPEKIEPEVEKVYEKFGLTAAEYQEFKKALTPQKEGELMRKIQDKMQILEREYK